MPSPFDPNAVPPPLTDELLAPYAPAPTTKQPEIPDAAAAKKKHLQALHAKRTRKYRNSPRMKARRRLEKLREIS